jgi:hypothetical protein
MGPTVGSYSFGTVTYDPTTLASLKIKSVNCLATSFRPMGTTDC